MEIKRWDELRIDVGKLQIQARESEKNRTQLVVLERRIQILQEEKTVLTSMERRLQERCAELQREVFRLQGNQQQDKYSTDSLEKRPIALPRQVPPPQSKIGSSENLEDEGISSSETGQSMSPEPPRTLPKNQDSQKYNISINESDQMTNKEDDSETTIEDVIEELQNIVNDAEREILIQREYSSSETIVTGINHQTLIVPTNENEIIPVNLLPQPPRKSRSLSHLLTNSDSDYGLLEEVDGKLPFFDDMDFDKKQSSGNHIYYSDEETPDVINHNKVGPNSNRAILNVIMDAREQEDQMIELRSRSLERANIPPPQAFNGVFFMTEMNNSKKYPKPDITAALEAKRVTKNLDRMETYGLDSMVDIVLTSDKPKNHKFYVPNRMSNTTSTPSGTSKNNSPFKIRTGHRNAGLYSGQHVIPEAARSLNHSGAKLTDLPSGLY